MFVKVEEKNYPLSLVTNHDVYVGKSGFVSHTKYITEATNMDLFHS